GCWKQNGPSPSQEETHAQDLLLRARSACAQFALLTTTPAEKRICRSQCHTLSDQARSQSSPRPESRCRPTHAPKSPGTLQRTRAAPRCTPRQLGWQCEG